MVVNTPMASDTPDECIKKFPHVFPACAVTRARAKQLRESEKQEGLGCPPEVVSPAAKEKVAPLVDSQTVITQEDVCGDENSIVVTEPSPVELTHGGPTNGHGVSDLVGSETDTGI